MKKEFCPYCQHELDDLDRCQSCFNLIDSNEDDDYLKVKRELSLAVRIDNIDLIMEKAKKVLEFKDNDFLGNYYNAYAYKYNGDDKKIQAFFNFDHIHDVDELREVVNHMIININLYGKDEVKAFITKNIFEGTKIKHYFDIIEGKEDFFSLDLNDLPLVELPQIPIKNKNIPLGKFLIIVGMILMFGFFFISYNLNNEFQPFTTIFLYILPSMFMAMGLTRLILKKGKFALSVVLFIVVLILSTYLVLLPYQQNFLNHVVSVATAPYDLVMYFMGKVFIDLWLRLET